MDDLGRRSPQPYGASATLIEPRNETAALERVTLVNLADVEAWRAASTVYYWEPQPTVPFWLTERVSRCRLYSVWVCKAFFRFPPEMEPIDLRPLNVLIGPNGSGKTNVIEAMELLRAVPTDLGKIIQFGGGMKDWLWKGDRESRARITLRLEGDSILAKGVYTYLLELGDAGFGHCIYDERIDKINSTSDPNISRPIFRFNNGNPVVTIEDFSASNLRTERRLKKETLLEEESILSQIKEPSLHPDLSGIGLQIPRDKDIFGNGFSARALTCVSRNV